MPALNSIAIQEMVLNSGSSSSQPSGMRPYLLAASHNTKTTKKLAARTKNQPRPLMAASLVPADTADNPGVSTRPHTTKAIEMTPVTPNTTQSRPGWASTGAMRPVMGANGCSWWAPAGSATSSCSEPDAGPVDPFVSSDIVLSSRQMDDMLRITHSLRIKQHFGVGCVPNRM